MTYPDDITRPTHCLAAAISLCISMASHSEEVGRLEEIVVTATKRAESLMDVPISVSAISGDKISNAGIQRSEDLAAYVPNFQVTQDPIGDKINIRGIQSGNQAGFEQSVATFVDGIYRGRGTQSRWAYLDVERVEVLRGPQPTLFGKNTVAGALNITTKQPTSEFESELSASYNPEFDESELQSIISGPLTDTLRGRAVVQYREMDEGWVANSVYGTDSPTSEELFARLAFDWTLGSATEMRFKYEKGDVEVLGHPFVLIEAGPLSPILAANGTPEGVVYESAMGNRGIAALGIPGDEVLDFGSAGKFDADTQEYVLRVDHEFGHGPVLTAIAGYSEYDFSRYLDGDFNPLPVIRFDDEEDFDQTSFELRLTSDTGGKFEYITGFYYQDSNLLSEGLSNLNLSYIDTLLSNGCNLLPDAPGLIVTGDPVSTAVRIAGLEGSSAAVTNACAQSALTQALVSAGVDGVNRYAYLDQSAETYAVFTQLTWNITDTFRATLGLRYTKEEKKASQGVWAGDYAARNKQALADGSGANPTAVAAYAIGEFTPHQFSPNDPGMIRDEESLPWSFNLQWDATPDAMLYASTATGFKAGGFNSFYMGRPQGAGANSSDVGFDEEEVLSFEVGAKLTLLDGSAELNIAAFHTSYEDLQVSIFSGNTTFIVQNAAEATSKGVEVDGRWQATDKLLLQASLGWLDFSYDAFPNQACVAEQLATFQEQQFQNALNSGGPLAAGLTALLTDNQACSSAGVNDMEGRSSAHTPEWSASFIASYRQPLGSHMLDASLDVNWMDEVYRQDDLDPVSLQDSFAKVNMMLMFGPTNGQWDIALIGKNLNDKDTFSFANDTPLFSGAREARVDPPRSVTVRARYRF
ncbi:MAG: TonB-dependent receptor [Haliea sp.]